MPYYFRSCRASLPAEGGCSEGVLWCVKGNWTYHRSQFSSSNMRLRQREERNCSLHCENMHKLKSGVKYFQCSSILKDGSLNSCCVAKLPTSGPDFSWSHVSWVLQGRQFLLEIFCFLILQTDVQQSKHTCSWQHAHGFVFFFHFILSVFSVKGLNIK